MLNVLMMSSVLCLSEYDVTPYRLFLHCQSPEFQPDCLQTWNNALQEIAFIGSYFEAKQGKGYLIGDDFFNYLTFLGCSPQLEVMPPESGQWNNFCFVEWVQLEKPRLVQGMNRLKCSCTSCRKGLGHLLQDGFTQHRLVSLSCPQCGNPLSLSGLNWQHTAGYGRFFICIHSVFPKEAVPSAEFMKALSGLSGQKSWQYFYVERDDCLNT